MRTRSTYVLASLACVAAFAGPALRAGEEPEIVTKTRADLPKIRERLEKLRGLKFKGDVKVSHQTDEEFRKFISKDMDTELPPEKAAAQSRAYARLGLLPEGYDIRKEVVDAAADQALAHYDPKQKTFFVLKTDMPEMMVAQTMIHELHHALQDNYADLRALYEGPAKADNEDGLNAVKFLVEGEATYIMLLDEVQRQMPGADDSMLHRLIEQQANMSRAEMDAMERQQLGMLGDKSGAMKKALDQRAKMPLYLYRSFLDPYMKGAALIAKLREKGGWAAVDAIWKEPPTSTSQVLRPAKKLIGDAREDPTVIDLPDLSEKLGAGWKRTLVNTMGELNTEVMFQVKGDETTNEGRPWRGWLGDRLHAYEKDAKEPAIIWFVTWTKDDFASRFEGAYSGLLAKKYPSSKEKKGEIAGKKATLHEDGAVTHAVLTSGSDTLVLEAVPTAQLEAVAQAALASKKTPSAKHPAKTGGGEK
jgi:hypothetical protein